MSKEVYSDPSLYRASPIAASLFRGIFYNAYFSVNSDGLRGLTVVWKFITIKNNVLPHRSLNYYSYSKENANRPYYSKLV